MEFFRKLYDLLRHLGEDEKWQAMVGYLGAHNLYVVLFAIIFAETGLVVTPFLPGDSLLFALGAIGRRGVGINLPVVTVLLMAAAVLGDAVNYWIGYRVGPKVFSKESSRLLNKKHLLRAHEFYEKYGGKTIILARFVPIVRTFAPVAAGVGKMHKGRYTLYNFVGAVLWGFGLTMFGYAIGFIPVVGELVAQYIDLILLAAVAGTAFFRRARTNSTAIGSTETITTPTMTSSKCCLTNGMLPNA